MLVFPLARLGIRLSVSPTICQLLADFYPLAMRVCTVFCEPLKTPRCNLSSLQNSTYCNAFARRDYAIYASTIAYVLAVNQPCGHMCTYYHISEMHEVERLLDVGGSNA